MLSDHAAQNLRTTSIGLSIWLLLWSSFGEGQGVRLLGERPRSARVEL